MQRLCRARRALAALLVAGAVAVAATVVPVVAAPEAAAYAGAPWFRPGVPYDQNFPDPSVLLVGDTYYAYGTSTGGAYLPVMTSTDLVTWTPRPRVNPPADSNDALPVPAAWGANRAGAAHGDPMPKEIWAPGAAKIGSQFVVFYTIRVRSDIDRFCISVATSPSPLGPFVDNSAGPIVCDDDPNGSIDPQPFVDSDGTPYLLWKSEGIPFAAPTRIWSQQLAPSGTSFAPGSGRSMLLETSQGWEGDVIENPSMVRYHGQLQLFYSANEHRSAAYAVGSATCASPLGPCSKSLANPVLASSGNRLGPGGASAFVDKNGLLQIAYHWWNAPYTSYPSNPGCDGTAHGFPTCTSQGQRRLAFQVIDPSSFGSAVGLAPSLGQAGYWVAREGGGVVARGAAPQPTNVNLLAGPAVGIAATPSGKGWWVTSTLGDIKEGGDAPDLGSLFSVSLARPVVGIAGRPGGGFWTVASDGGIFSFGDAPFFGSTGAIGLNQPVVGMATTPSGNGYWLVASDGGIFTFGDAKFFGSTGAIRLNQPVVGMAATPSGNGYWLVASDGGIFTFGDAPFFGSTGGIDLVQPVTGMASTSDGKGYWMVARDGGVFTFGTAPFHGKG